MWILTRHHRIIGEELPQAIASVARYRNVRLRSIANELNGFHTIGQTGWFRWREQQDLSFLPKRCGEVVDAVIDFAEAPAHDLNLDGGHLRWVMMGSPTPIR